MTPGTADLHARLAGTALVLLGLILACGIAARAVAVFVGATSP